jgi:hypothetical protein
MRQAGVYTEGLVFRLFITERKGNIHWNVPSRVDTEGNMLPACMGAGAQSPWLDAGRSQELRPTNRRPTCRATVSYRARLLATVPYRAKFAWAPGA